MTAKYLVGSATLEPTYFICILDDMQWNPGMNICPPGFRCTVSAQQVEIFL